MQKQKFPGGENGGVIVCLLQESHTFGDHR